MSCLLQDIIRVTSSVFTLSNLKREKRNRENSLGRDPKKHLLFLGTEPPVNCEVADVFFNLLVVTTELIS